MNDPVRIRRDFGRAAATYRAAANVQREAAAWLAEGWRIGTGLALDLGSGPGSLATLLPQENWLQIDSAEPMGRLAGRHAPFVCADATQLPFPDATFDWLASNLCLQWLPIADALAEWRRVSRPGARLVATLPVAGSLHELSAAYRTIGEAPRLLAFAEAEAVAAAAEASGWRIEALDRRDIAPQERPSRLLRQIAAIGGRYKGPLPPLGPKAMRRLLAAYTEKDGQATMTYRIARLTAVAR